MDVKKFYTDQERSDGVVIRARKKGIRIELIEPGEKIRTSPVLYIGAIGILFKDASKLRKRHLKLGVKYFFQYIAARMPAAGKRDSRDFSTLNFSDNWDSRVLTFTIAVTVHNQSAFEITRSINSIIGQTRKPDAIEVLDDGSTRPETIRALSKLKAEYPSIKFRRSKNRGVIASRNFLISICKTSHLLFCDPDDELNLTYLSSAEKIFQSDRTIEIVYPNVKVRTIGGEKNWITGPFDAKLLQLINTIPMSSVCSITFFRELNGYSHDFEDGYEDWDLWVRAALSGVRASRLNEYGYYYTEKKISRSSSAQRSATRLKEQIQERAFGQLCDVPQGFIGKTDIFIVAPWFIQGGGVDAVLDRLIQHYKKKKVTLVTTEGHPLHYVSAITKELREKIAVVERSDFKSDESFLFNLKKLSSNNSVIINLSAPWAFDNATRLADIAKHHFGFAFNEIGAERVLNCQGKLTEIWPVFRKLGNDLAHSKRIDTPIEIIHIGIPNKIMKNKQKVNRKRLVVGWLGRLSPEKDPYLFIELGKSVDPKEYVFRIAGDGPLREKVESRLIDAANISYSGFVKSAADFLRNLDILVITSEIEGIPLVAMEALKLGVYVVAPDVGGLPDLIKDKRDGLLYPRSKANAISALHQARKIILAGQAVPKLEDEFSETTMFAHIDSRINYYLKLEEKERS